MPYDVNWHNNEHTIIRIDIHGQNSWAQHDTAIEKVFQEMANVSHRVDIIYNGKEPLPPGNPMPHIKKVIARFDKYPNLGLVIVVTPQQLSVVIKALIDITMRIFQMTTKHNGGFVTSLGEAEAIIERDRAQAAPPPNLGSF